METDQINLDRSPIFDLPMKRFNLEYASLVDAELLQYAEALRADLSERSDSSRKADFKALLNEMSRPELEEEVSDLIWELSSCLSQYTIVNSIGYEDE